MRSLGIDLSEWDLRPLDWEKARSLLDFAFIKISQGTNPDPLFGAQWRASEGYVLRGFYHMLDTFDDVSASVDRTIELYKQVSPGELPPALDLELGRSSFELPRARAWLERWRNKTGGVRPIIYTSLGFLAGEQYKTENKWIGEYPLWLASWPYDNLSEDTRRDKIRQVLSGAIVIPYPGAFRPWPISPDWYQWTSRGEPGDIPGYYMGQGHKKAVDLNYYNGTRADLFRQYGEPTKAPGNGEGMDHRYSITPASSSGSKVRTDHYVIDSPVPNRIGSLPYGRSAFGDEKWISPAGASESEAVEVWLRVKIVDGVPLDGWIAAKHNGTVYARISETGLPGEEEPPTPAPSIDIDLSIEATAGPEGLNVSITATSPGYGPGSFSITLPPEL